jgi:hypothetical protein
MSTRIVNVIMTGPGGELARRQVTIQVRNWFDVTAVGEAAIAMILEAGKHLMPGDSIIVRDAEIDARTRRSIP